MKTSTATGRLPVWIDPRHLLVTGLVALACVLQAGAAHAAQATLSKEDQACLECHDKVGFKQDLGNGETRSLHVSTQAYLASMHKETSCEDCHDNLDAKTHGKEKVALKPKRDLSQAMQQSCRTCHKAKYKQYDDSIHASLVKEGSREAPLCSNCHDPHTLKSVKLVEPIANTPCATCHDEIYKAYAADVHGQERSAKGKAAPICADCHRAHDVKAASLGDGAKDACLACHKTAEAEHRDWLPNVGLHFEAISCAACHSPNAQRRVNLRLYDGKAQRRIIDKSGVPRFELVRASAGEPASLGLDERAVLSLLREFNRDDAEGDTVLRGRLELRSGVDAHRIADKSRALKDCRNCHQKDAAPFQSVVLSIAGPDGRPLRHGVQKDVLSSLTALESVRGFYAIGSTRIKLLDQLLVMVVLGSLSVPIVHMAVKRMTQSMRERRLAEQQAAARAQAASAAPAPTAGAAAGDDARNA